MKRAGLRTSLLFGLVGSLGAGCSMITSLDGFTGGAPGAPIAYEADLSGAEETPPTTGAFHGKLTLSLSADRTTLTYDLTHNVTDAVLAHIHEGAAGETGDAVIPFMPIGTHIAGSAPITPDQVALLETGRLYVNIHNPANPNGVIRGQILHPGEKVYVATLTGAQETPPVTTTSTGDAAIIVDAIRANVRYHLKTTAALTRADVHSGLATIAGPAVHELAPLGATIDGTVAITDADAADLEDGHWYANVHTAANPEGEIRGQVLLPGETLYAAVLSPMNESPPAAGSTASGGGEFVLSPDRTSFRYELLIAGTTATKASICAGAAFVDGPILYPLALGGLGAKGAQALMPADVTALAAAGLYANVSSAAFPDGEMRGQILNR